MDKYKKYVKPYLSAFILGPIFMIVEVLGEVILPKLMSIIINYGCGQGGYESRGIGFITLIGGAMILTAVFMMAGGVLGAYFAVKASVNFAADLRRDVFKKVQEFSFANIEKFSTGSLVTRLTNDITNMQNVISIGLRMLLRAPGMLIGGLIMAFVMNWRLAIVFCVVIPLLIIAIVLIMRVALPRFNIMQTKIDSLNSRIQENITNQRVVKSFVRDDFEKKTFDTANEDLKDNTLRAMKVVIMTIPIMTLAMNITVMAVVWFGGRQIIVGSSMAVGDLTAFTTYVTQILMSLMMVSMIFIQGSRAMASSRRILEVLDTKVDLNDEEASMTDKKVEKGEIEFRHVGFRYYKKHKNNVLQDINFVAHPGEVIGIIGSTGSGKSSLVQLIPRLYDCDEGEVLVDGVNVKEYSLEHLRNGVAMVLQKNTLFSGTIMDNLRWGDEHASDEEVRQAAEAAQADLFVRDFNEGYNMELGQGGVNVSGGQKQRLCIARALLKKPKILILDDSTSAVDTATEAKIRQSFSTTLKDTTKLIIAQRISSVETADRILVMDEGRIVGQGTHEELLNTCEAYQEIYYSQMSKKEVAQ